MQGFYLLSNENNQITLRWNESVNSDIVNYNIYYNEDIEGPPFEYSQNIGIDSIFTISGLYGIYYFAITCVNQSGVESWYSNNVTVNTNQDPEPFSLTYPTNNDTIETLTPVFQWEASSDPDTSDNITYRIYIAGIGTYTTRKFNSE